MRLTVEIEIEFQGRPDKLGRSTGALQNMWTQEKLA